MERREGYQVGVLFLGVIRGRDRKQGVADLLDVDSLAKTGLLCVISLEVDAGGSIRDAVSRRGWVVAGKARWLGLASGLASDLI